jgi:hypothetical protein
MIRDPLQGKKDLVIEKIKKIYFVFMKNGWQHCHHYHPRNSLYPGRHPSCYDVSSI